MLQGLPSYQTLQMPTCGFAISDSVIPTAYSMACDAPCALGWVICELYLFNTGLDLLMNTV